MTLYKKILIFLFITLSSINLYAYSYAAAGKEPTIDARESILKFVNSSDFGEAATVFEKTKKNYTYLSGLHDKNLVSSLKVAIDNKNVDQINKWLNVSLAAEINRRLDGGLKNIKVFNVSKVMLAKANKFFKLLEPSLTKEKKEDLSIAIKGCIKAIGNPGLFGVGAKPANKDNFIKYQQKVLSILKSL